MDVQFSSEFTATPGLSCQSTPNADAHSELSIGVAYRPSSTVFHVICISPFPVHYIPIPDMCSADLGSFNDIASLVPDFRVSLTSVRLMTLRRCSVQSFIGN